MDILPIQDPIVMTSWAGAFIIFTWFVLRPFVGLFTRWFIARQNGTSVSVEDRLCKIENEQYHFLTGEINKLEAGFAGFRKEVRDKLSDIEHRLTVLETRFNMK